MSLSRSRIAALTSTNAGRRTLALLSIAPVEWDTVSEFFHNARVPRTGVGQMLQDIAVNIIRLGVYLEERGEQVEHAQAVKRQNTIARRVRKALGFHVTPDIKV